MLTSARRPSLGLIGTGRVATALGRAARAADVPMAWVAGRTPAHAGPLARQLDCPATTLDAAPTAGLVVVAVTDSAVEAVTARLAGAAEPGAAVHTCGARGRDALEPLAAVGWATGAWHPLQAFARVGTPLLPGVVFGITADPALTPLLDDLSRRLGGRPAHLDEADRARYHAAAAMASNYTDVLLFHATRLLEQCGLPGKDALDALLSLVRSSLEGVEESGPVLGLTGPVTRGDADTLRRHLAALDGQGVTADLYRACGLAALPIVVERGLPPEQFADLRAALS